MVGIISERASRPLIKEKSPEVREEAIKQIVKKAEERVMDGKSPQVTSREVKEIIEDLRPLEDVGKIENEVAESEILNTENTPIGGIISEQVPQKPFSEMSSEERKERIKQLVRNADEHGEQEQPIREDKGPIEALKEWVDRQEANANKPAIPKIVTDVLDLKGIRSMLKGMNCPCCGKAVGIEFTCCGATIDCLTNCLLSGVQSSEIVSLHCSYQHCL